MIGSMVHCGSVRSSALVGPCSGLVDGFPLRVIPRTRMRRIFADARERYGTVTCAGAGYELGPRRLVRMRATGGDDMNEKESKNDEEEEARLEAFEARLRSSSSSSGSLSRQRKNASNTDMQERRGRAEWKKGELFPEGWEEMDPIEKATEIYLGERGILYWSTQLTIWGLVLLVAAWVVFRFLGPSLGLYALDNDPNL